MALGVYDMRRLQGLRRHGRNLKNLVVVTAPEIGDCLTKNVVWFLLGCAAFVYLARFTVTGVPIYRAGDELIYLENAVRLVDGQTLYRDFFQFTPPGTEFVYFCFFKLAGIRAWIPGAVLVLLGLGFTWLSVAITRRLISGVDVFLPSLLFLTCAYYWWPDGTHHWFSNLCVLAALATVIENRTPARLGVAGALCGLALCFTQLRGLLAVLGLSSFLFWEDPRNQLGRRLMLRNQASVFAPFLATVAAFNAYFAWKAGLARFLWCTITFGAKYYPAYPGNTWRVLVGDFPRSHSWSHQLVRVAVFLFLRSVIPLVYVLCFVLHSRLKESRLHEPWGRLMLVNFMSSSLFIGIAPAPDDLRLSSIALPAFILMVSLLHGSTGKGRSALRALWAGALTLAILEPGTRQTHPRDNMDLPTGRMAFLDPSEYEMHRWVRQRVGSSGFLFEEWFPRMNFTLNLRNPTPLPLVTNTDYTRPEQVVEVIHALDGHHVRLVMVAPSLTGPIFGRDWGDHLEPLRAYLRSHYHLVKTFPREVREEVWERNDEPVKVFSNSE